MQIKPFFKREHFTFLCFSYIENPMYVSIRILVFQILQRPTVSSYDRILRYIIIIFSHNFFQTSPHFFFLWIPELILSFFHPPPKKMIEFRSSLSFFGPPPKKMIEFQSSLSFFGPQPKKMIEFRRSLSFFLFSVPRQK